ncbi:hypothetical protein DLJ49_18715 [Rhodovulum sp. 12E13]|uniref:hypothetical protein n=1 Tax=Rhodovulum sp. 12E13 TaxID=2203891 RepID=UPI000E1213AD|nr:hypothetical protein [Rhodovulum sp. 12E13]RDC69672.1 hypothetical protein DLJ49_18715 [Rhodovulum sp. 12E13]
MLHPRALPIFSQAPSILGVADPHVFQNETHDTMDRFIAIGRLALDRKPDVLVLMGDVGDFFFCRKDIEVIDGDRAWGDCMAFNRLLKNSRPGDTLENRAIFHDLSSSWWPTAVPGIGLLDERALSRTFFSSLLSKPCR